jgi:hypothetical protein
MDAQPRGIVVEQEQIAQRLLDVGVRAVIDPRRIEIPCALVVPERATVTGTLACSGAFNTEWVISVIGGPTSGQDTMRVLSAITAQIVQGAEISNMTIELSSRSIDTGDLVPCFDIRWESISDWVGAHSPEPATVAGNQQKEGE